MYVSQTTRGAQLLAHLIVFGFVVSVASSQKYQYEQPPRSSSFEGGFSTQQQAAAAAAAAGADGSPEELGGEHVDRMSSASGDQYRNSAQQQQFLPWSELYRLLCHQAGCELQPINYATLAGGGGAVEASMSDVGRTDKRQMMLPTFNGRPFETESGNNYRELVDEYKHLSPLANPSRESRAFKPKLMSTARGFGKRASPLVSVDATRSSLLRRLAHAGILVSPYTGSGASVVEDGGQKHGNGVVGNG